MEQFEIRMPRLSEAMTEGKVLHWAVRRGDFVTPGDVVGEIETDKANMELEATEPGFVVEILAPAGSVVSVGAPLLRMAQSLDELAAAERQASPDTMSTVAAPVKIEDAVPLIPPQEEGAAEVWGEDNVSPLARELALQMDVDLSEVKGSGPGGRVMRQDVLEQIRRREARIEPVRVAENTGGSTIQLDEIVAQVPPLERAPAAGRDDRVPLIDGVECVTFSRTVDVSVLWRSLAAISEQLQLVPRLGPAELLPVLVGRAFVLAARGIPTAGNPSFTATAEEGCVAIAVGPPEKRAYPTLFEVDTLALTVLLRKFAEERERALAGTLRWADCQRDQFAVESLIGIRTRISAAHLREGSSPVIFLTSQRDTRVGVDLVVRALMDDVARWATVHARACEMLESPLELAERFEPEA